MYVFHLLPDCIHREQFAKLPASVDHSPPIALPLTPTPSLHPLHYHCHHCHHCHCFHCCCCCCCRCVRWSQCMIRASLFLEFYLLRRLLLVRACHLFQLLVFE